MTSKERAKAIFTGGSFDRLPMWYGGAAETTRNVMEFLGAKDQDEAMDMLGIDFKLIRPKFIGPTSREAADGTKITIYDGNIWGIKRGGYEWGQALNHPLAHAETVKEVEAYDWPKPEWYDVNFSQSDVSKLKDYYVISGLWTTYFQDVLELFGMEKMFVDMYLNPEIVEAALEKVYNVYYEINAKTFAANKGIIDMFFFANDYGSQRSLLLSRDLWVKFIKPGVKKYVNLCHKYDMKVSMHSCGDIHEIIPDLIDAGLDVLNPIQVSAQNMDPAVLKREYGKDIIFFGAIDENEILPHGTEEETRAETRRIIDILGPDGKYIVAASHDYLMPEIPARNICAMFDEAKNYSKKYSR